MPEGDYDESNDMDIDWLRGMGDRCNWPKRCPIPRGNPTEPTALTPPHSLGAATSGVHPCGPLSLPRVLRSGQGSARSKPSSEMTWGAKGSAKKISRASPTSTCDSREPTPPS